MPGTCANTSHIPAPTGNRLVANGLALDYDVPGMDDEGICVSFSDDDLATETKKWEHTLGYMEMLVDKAWGSLAVSVLHQFDDGFFIAEDCDLAMSSGPFTVKNQPLILKKWTLNFEFKHDQLTTLPI